MKKFRYIYTVLAVLFSAAALVGCTQVSADDPLYVYGIGLDAVADDVHLYVLTGKDKKDNSSGESGKEKNNGQDGGSKSFQIMRFDGDDVDDAFEEFFEDFRDVYTGTNKIYVVGENMSEELVREFKIYLTNSNKLPVKKDIITDADPFGYLERNAGVLTEK